MNTIHTKSQKRKYIVNDDSFDDLNEHSEYWIGFIAGDGCVKHNTLILSLQKSDVEHIKKFKEFLQCNYPIHFHKTNNSCSIRICSNKICNTLLKYGITEKKSKTFKVPLTLQNSRHFWRGFFDADGCIHLCKSIVKQKPFYSLIMVGNKNTCNSFKKYCMNHIVSKASVLESNGSYRYQLTTKKCKTILNVMYNDNTISLNRKNDSYLKVNKINYRDKILKFSDYELKEKFDSIFKHENYDYTQSKYINYNTNIKIKCKIHGEFEKKPSSLFRGYGCPSCGRENQKIKVSLINKKK